MVYRCVISILNVNWLQVCPFHDMAIRLQIVSCQWLYSEYITFQGLVLLSAQLAHDRETSMSSICLWSTMAVWMCFIVSHHIFVPHIAISTGYAICKMGSQLDMTVVVPPDVIRCTWGCIEVSLCLCLENSLAGASVSGATIYNQFQCIVCIWIIQLIAHP